MCGFVGYVEDGEKDRKIIKSMSDTIKHRGPDDEGFMNIFLLLCGILLYPGIVEEKHEK